MFCTSLRRRASVSCAVPILTSPTGLNLREENSLKTHDLAITVHHAPDSRRTLRILLLTPSTVADAALPKTLERVRRFSALTGGTDVAILFLLHPSTSTSSSNTANVVSVDPLARTGDLRAYARLTTALLADDASAGDGAPLFAVPVLPLHSLASLPATVQLCIGALRSDDSAPTAAKVPDAAMEILPCCTTAPMMSQQAVFMLTDLHRDLREVALMAAEAGKEVRGDGDSESWTTWEELVDAIGEKEASGLVEFWMEEWVAE